MKLKLESAAFEKQGAIPKRYTGEGEDVSPPLTWSRVPEGTREFVLICEDPDAPGPGDQPFVHWVIYNISPSVTALPEALAAQPDFDIPVRANQGRNSFGNIGYGGPMPPVGHGVHRYIFTLYALNAELAVPPGATRDELLYAMDGHILDSDQLTGLFERKDASQAA